MTQDQDFKQLVRERMAQTEQPFTAARADLLAERRRHEEAARREHHKLVRPFVDGERLVSMPMKRKARAAVLLWLLPRFEVGRAYRETEVNALLRPAHEDVAYVRRELVDLGYLTRRDGVYRLPADVPARDARWVHEFPAWERVWLPSFLRGTADSADA